MLALRGIIILGGLVFMFLPGVLVSLASQRGLRYNEQEYGGMWRRRDYQLHYFGKAEEGNDRPAGGQPPGFSTPARRRSMCSGTGCSRFFPKIKG
jgi:hypothetical protein